MAVNLDSVSSVPQHPTGHRYIDPFSQRIFRYVKYNEGVTPKSGGVGFGAVWLTDSAATPAGPTEGVVTCDIPGGNHVVNPAGFMQAALTDGKYGWIQVRGTNRKAIGVENTSISSANQGVMLSANAGDEGKVVIAPATGSNDQDLSDAYPMLGKSLKASTTGVETGSLFIQID